MYDIIFFAALCLIITFALYLKARRDIRNKYSHIEENQEDPAAYDSTRSLIGDEAYEEMTRRVDTLLSIHRCDESVAVCLTSGPDNRPEADELHHLLPGEPVKLTRNDENGVECVDVYSRGFRIGRLMLADAEIAIEVMRDSMITGVYVAEQNCYGDCEDIAMRLVIFHCPERRHISSAIIDERKPYRVRFQGINPIELFQN